MISVETRKKLSNSHKGMLGYWTGKKRPEMIGNDRGFKKGQIPWNSGKRIILACRFCKVEYNVILARKEKSKYCSRKCKGDWQSENLIGEKSSSWAGGFVPAYKYMRNWRIAKEWRKAVFNRDNYTCQSCQKTNCYLEAHHLLPFSFFPDLRWVVSNGQTLCKECHALTKKGGGTKLWVQSLSL